MDGISQNQLGPLLTALAAIRDGLGSLPKDGWNDFHKYHFVSESAMTAALKPLMEKHGIVILPSVACDYEPRIDEHGVTHLIMEYTICHTSGVVLPEKLRVFASGDDHNKNGWGDKGAYKASTGAMKFLLHRLFFIDTDDDPERDKKPKRTAQKPRTPTKNPRAKKTPAENSLGPEQLTARATERAEQLIDDASRLDIKLKYGDVDALRDSIKRHAVSFLDLTGKKIEPEYYSAIGAAIDHAQIDPDGGVFVESDEVTI